MVSAGTCKQRNFLPGASRFLSGLSKDGNPYVTFGAFTHHAHQEFVEALILA